MREGGNVHASFNSSSSNSKSNNNNGITELYDNDVLLGRGKETINFIGNVRFRVLIEAKKVR